MVLNYNAVTTALKQGFIAASSKLHSYAYMYIFIIFLVLVLPLIPPTHTYLWVCCSCTCTVHPSHWLIIVCSPSSSVAVRDENKDEDSDDDNKENEVPQWHLPYAHTYMYCHTEIWLYAHVLLSNSSCCTHRTCMCTCVCSLVVWEFCLLYLFSRLHVQCRYPIEIVGILIIAGIPWADWEFGITQMYAKGVISVQ